MDNEHRGAGAGIEKGAYDDSKVPFMTARTFFMCILVSMGGICFGYDTGQVCILILVLPSISVHGFD